MCAAQLFVLALMALAASHIGAVEEVRGVSPLSIAKLRKLRAELDAPMGGGGVPPPLDSRNEMIQRERCQFNASFPRLAVKAKHYTRALVRRVEGFGSCALVGDARSLLDDRYGDEIDEAHDLVLRFDEAPVARFARHVGTRTSVQVAGTDAISRRLERTCSAEAEQAGEGAMADGARRRANGTAAADAELVGCPSHHTFVSAGRGGAGVALAKRCHSARAGVFPVPELVRDRALELLTPSGAAEPSSEAIGVLLAMLMCPNGITLYGFNRLDVHGNTAGSALGGSPPVGGPRRAQGRYGGRARTTSRVASARAAQQAVAQAARTSAAAHAASVSATYHGRTSSLGTADTAPGTARLLDMLAKREASGCVTFRGAGESSVIVPPRMATAARELVEVGDADGGDGDAGSAGGEDGGAEEDKLGGSPSPGCDRERLLEGAAAAGDAWDPLAHHSDRAHVLRIAQLVCALVVAIGGLGYTLFSCTHMMHAALKYAVD